MNFKNIVLACLAICTAMAMAGCNTIHGIGQDVKSVGQGVENAAK